MLGLDTLISEHANPEPTTSGCLDSTHKFFDWLAKILTLTVVLLIRNGEAISIDQERQLW